MFGWLLNLLFGCRHRKTSFPMTPVDPVEAGHGAFVVCLDCGKRFSYDWDRMRSGPAVKERESGNAKTGRAN
jgi:hypothetical protein